jgi:hypothetical protein
VIRVYKKSSVYFEHVLNGSRMSIISKFIFLANQLICGVNRFRITQTCLLIFKGTWEPFDFKIVTNKFISYFKNKMWAYFWSQVWRDLRRSGKNVCWISHIEQNRQRVITIKVFSVIFGTNDTGDWVGSSVLCSTIVGFVRAVVVSHLKYRRVIKKI